MTTNLTNSQASTQCPPGLARLHKESVKVLKVGKDLLVNHDDGEVLAVMNELVHEGHGVGPAPYHQVVAGQGGHLQGEMLPQLG